MTECSDRHTGVVGAGNLVGSRSTLAAFVFGHEALGQLLLVMQCLSLDSASVFC